ncbi:uncharacterized protein C22orf31-like [Pangasianodon hypophthalmus]|uniref:uncharacterized protein C22orf31-like n=1 Tax=Pangasianodon hypophthalmus TaxID=310915 RepID=UPI00230727F1|nr:uncharacterized protein C22orf31-like [Pangasianodon hypophthalmus]
MEAAQRSREHREEPRKLEPHLEECYFVNAAVLPEFRPRPSSFAAAAPRTRSASESLMEQPLMIHGLSIPEYQRLYHSVEDPMLVTSTGQLRCYSMKLGLRIKQLLWETLNCPSLIEVQLRDSKQIRYTEKFKKPSLKSFAPHFDLDTSKEPKPQSQRGRGKRPK